MRTNWEKSEEKRVLHNELVAFLGNPLNDGRNNHQQKQQQQLPTNIQKNNDENNRKKAHTQRERETDCILFISTH